MTGQVRLERRTTDDIDTSKPYGPMKMGFKFDQDGPTEKVGYHWNNHARSYTNIGIAMAIEMPKLARPKRPSRFRAQGCDQGVRLDWQLGTETPGKVEILRNGDPLYARISPGRTTFIDDLGVAGENNYEVILTLPSGVQKMSARCDTSATNLKGYRSLNGVMLSWKARGKYESFRIKRDGKIIANQIASGIRRFEDQAAPNKGKITDTIAPTTGKVTPASVVVNLGPWESGGAIVYEPFDDPASDKEVQIITGNGGALGTKGHYIDLSEKAGREPATVAQGLSYGRLPVTGNRGSTHRWSSGGYIELDDRLAKSGLLEDGATMWLSYLFLAETDPTYTHRSGGGTFTLRSDDMKEGIGFRGSSRQIETVVVLEGKELPRRIGGTRPNTPILVVGRITWGKGGAEDQFVPFFATPDLKCSEKPGRASVPFNIDQMKLSRLVLSGEDQFDEIRVGPTFDSVVGGAR